MGRLCAGDFVLPAEDVDGRITPLTLRLAKNDYLDAESVGSYLELLRVDSPCARIVDIRELLYDCNEIGDERLDLPIIVPFQDGDGWAFAVADDRPVVEDWTGPKQPDWADSGVLMLLGIRQIQHGVSGFDTVELLCGKLNPTESDFENLVAHVKQEQEQSLFFENATYGMNLRDR
ncbi:hypothetical protein HJFPF1_10706 [Paramyrothecium foliicola]|nr:hypothetical protein HJFPF1_10706 [Paramyrothecium foliicola]